MPFFSDFSYPSSTGKHDIYTKTCIPDDKVRGIIQITHGLAEHIGRYDDFMYFMADNGFVAVGNDHLGHGETAKYTTDLGSFSETDGWFHVVEDTITLQKKIKKDYPSLPFISFGHSMGSFIVRTCLIQKPDFCDAAILSGTAHPPSKLIRSGVSASRFVKAGKESGQLESSLFHAVLKSCLKRIDQPRTEYDWISRDPEAVDGFIEDPKCGFILKPSLFHDILSGLSFITSPEKLSDMNKDIPTLFLSGSEDPVGEYGKGVSRAYQSFCHAGMKDVTLRLYTGGRHEMLHELNHTEVKSDILNWITHKVMDPT